MGKQRSSFAKLQRDRAKAAKKAAKQAQKHNKGVDPFGPLESSDVEVAEEVEGDEMSASVAEMFEGKGELTAPELLQMIEDIHKKREAGLITEEDFEDAKVELFARLPMD